MRTQWPHIQLSFFLLLLLSGAILFLNGCSGLNSSKTTSSTSSSTGSIALSTASLSFSSQVVNTSSSKNLTVTNTGTGALTLSMVSVTGVFSETNNCPATLDSGADCTVSVSFAPTAVGTDTGTLSITTSSGSQQVSLLGTCVAAGQLVVNPSAIAFGSVTEGQNSSQTVTASNPGGQSITISAVSTSGSEFAVSGLSLQLVVAAGQSSSFSVSFDPATSGSVTGTVSLTNSGPVSDVTIALTGTGAAPMSGSHEVVLTWSGSSSQVTGYYTYRGSVSGGPYSKLTSAPIDLTSYTDQNVIGGNTYYYVVTAVDDAGLESSYSEQVEAVIPSS